MKIVARAIPAWQELRWVRWRCLYLCAMHWRSQLLWRRRRGRAGGTAPVSFGKNGRAADEVGQLLVQMASCSNTGPPGPTVSACSSL